MVGGFADMTYFKKIIAVFAALLALLPATDSIAETAVRPRDFVHSHELNITLEGAIHRFTLPRFVYEGLIQSQRLDLAVFNSGAEIVPFAVREAAPVYQLLELPEIIVPFYELPPASRRERAENFIGPLNVYVQTGLLGQIISVTSGDRGEGLRERRYLLDFSSVVPDFSSVTEPGEVVKHELRLALPDVRISARVSVFDSRDLRDWRPLLTDATLIQLQSGGSRLVSDRFELSRAPRSYVLLEILDVDPSFELKGIGYSAMFQSRHLREESAEIEGAPAAGEGNPAFEYDTLGAFPVSGINFVLQEPGFYMVRFFSRPNTDAEWRARGEKELLKIMNLGGDIVLNGATPVSTLQDRFWRVEFDGAFSGAPPVMRISWRPAEVFFMAQGGAPYALLFGSERRDNLFALQNDSFLRIAGRDFDAAAAEIGSPIDPTQHPSLAPGNGYAAAPLGEEAEWQRYLVWALLVLGGVMLSVMAFKLLKKN